MKLQKLFIFISVFLCFCSCKYNSEEPLEANSVLITQKDYASFLELYTNIDSLRCENKTVYLKLQDSRKKVYNYCTKDKIFRSGYSMTIHDEKDISFNNISIFMSDKDIKMKMEEFIINPRKLNNGAESANRAPFYIKFEDYTPLDKVFAQINRLNNIYEEIKLSYDLESDFLIMLKLKRNPPPPPPLPD